MVPFPLPWRVPHHHPHEMRRVLQISTSTEEIEVMLSELPEQRGLHAAYRLSVRRPADLHIHELRHSLCGSSKQPWSCRHHINFASTNACHLLLLRWLLVWVKELC